MRPGHKSGRSEQGFDALTGLNPFKWTRKMSDFFGQTVQG